MAASTVEWMAHRKAECSADLKADWMVANSAAWTAEW